MPDRSIDPRILQNAREEFLSKGFEGASLKTICDAAGVTTGALYKRYSGKEGLFCALVQQTVDDLEEVMQTRSAQNPHLLSDQDLIDAWEMTDEIMMWWFTFLQERRDGFVLLLHCAAGTRYANFQHDWVERMTCATYVYYQTAFDRGLTETFISQKEMHILLTAFWSCIYEPFIHGLTWPEIEAHCRLVCKLFDFCKVLGFR